MRTAAFFLIGILCLSGVKQQAQQSPAVAFYLFKECHFALGKCQVDSLRSTLQDSPVISNQDILEYSPADHQFKLTDAAIQEVRQFRDNMAFAVTVDRQVIYYGIFKPATSSSSCDHSVTMDLDRGSRNKININMGYPTTLKAGLIPDQRNNEQLITALERQGKLR